MIRTSEYPPDVESLISFVTLARVDAIKNGTTLNTNYLSNFSSGLNYDYLYNYSMILGKFCYGFRLGSSGDYVLKASAVVGIDTYTFDVAVQTSTF